MVSCLGATNVKIQEGRGGVGVLLPKANRKHREGPTATESQGRSRGDVGDATGIFLPSSSSDSGKGGCGGVGKGQDGAQSLAALSNSPRQACLQCGSALSMWGLKFDGPLLVRLHLEIRGSQVEEMSVYRLVQTREKGKSGTQATGASASFCGRTDL